MGVGRHLHGSASHHTRRETSAEDSGDPFPGTTTNEEAIELTPKASITVLGPREEIERRWHSTQESQWTPTFRAAPGDRGTEIHLEAGRTSMAKAKAELRRFKQLCETGEIPRSDATPDGDRPARLLKQRPAQPLENREAVPA